MKTVAWLLSIVPPGGRRFTEHPLLGERYQGAPLVLESDALAEIERRVKEEREACAMLFDCDCETKCDEWPYANSMYCAHSRANLIRSRAPK